MPRIRMLRDWDFRHTPNAMTAYQAKKDYRVTTRCADAAIAAGAAEYTPLELARRAAIEQPAQPARARRRRTNADSAG